MRKIALQDIIDLNVAEFNTEFKADEFRGKLLKWFRVNKRDLPWRTNHTNGYQSSASQTLHALHSLGDGGSNPAPAGSVEGQDVITNQRDPYSVVVSEVMLQQTQVTTVLRFYENWMAQFPTFEALAAAPIEKVLKAWEGLGYYTRARNLKKLAEVVVTQHSGQLPRNIEELHKLPGIGPYSARSIASLAFNVPAACVDGNIVRVLSRLMAIDKSYKSGSAAQQNFQPIADQISGVTNSSSKSYAQPTAPQTVSPESRGDGSVIAPPFKVGHTRESFNYGEHNEALMEFGATVCTKANPACPICPLRDLCKAYALGIAEELPRFEKTKTITKEVKRAWVMHEGKLLLHQSSVGNNAETGKLHGLWELPTPETLGITRLPDKELLRRVRNITKYKITEVIYRITKLEKLLPRIEKKPHLRWASIEDLQQLPMSGPHAQWIGEILGRKSALP